MIPIFLAVDTAQPDRAQAWLNALGDLVDIKLGLQFFISNALDGCRYIRNFGASRERQLFLDLKLHDIPTTVGSAVRACIQIQPDFISVHTTGGPEMMKAAVASAHEEADRLGYRRPKVLGVTVLTSLDVDISLVIGRGWDARIAGLDGVVCSPLEAQILRTNLGKDFYLMCPGIRMSHHADDQRRAATARQAMDNGADAIVVGRAITASDDPRGSLDDIIASLA